MLRQLIERVTAKAVAVTIVVVVVVVVVPVTVLSVAPGDESAVRVAAVASHARTQPTAAPKKIPPRVKVKFESEDLIAALRSAEAACLASLTSLTTSSGLTAGQSKPILDNARARLDIAVVPLVIRVQADEYEVARARALTPQQLAVYVTDISNVRLTALGTGDKQGSIAVLCSTVTVQVQQQIAVLKPPPAPSWDGGDGGD